MPNARPARPRRRPLNPREEARRMTLIQELSERLDRFTAAFLEKRRQDLGPPE